MGGDGLLDGKRVLVTGASRGIGATIAQVFAQQGANLILVSRTTESLDKVAQECTKAGAKEVDVRPCQLTEGEDVKRLSQSILKDYGHVDVLVLAAGVFEYSGALEGDVDSTEKLMYLNLTSPVQMTQILAPAMAEKGNCNILIISSVAGVQAIGNQAVYAASKHGITGWCNSIQQELTGKVRVTGIYPAKTNTKMAEGRGPGEEMIQPEDIAEAALLPFRMTDKACPSEIVIRNAANAGGT